jgi:hypothetical protein
MSVAFYFAKNKNKLDYYLTKDSNYNKYSNGDFLIRLKIQTIQIISNILAKDGGVECLSIL